MNRIHWIRVVVSGILLEVALVAVLVPIGEVFGAPAGLGRNQTGHYATFFTAVPVACFLLGFFAGWLVGRRVSAHAAAHGFAVGAVGTTFYVVMSSLNPQGLSAVIAAYGTMHFWGTQIARLAGCSLGGMFSSSRRQLARPTA